MKMVSIAQLGAMLDPESATKLQLIERQAELGFQAASALEVVRHQNRLAEMDRDLTNRLAEMDRDLGNKLSVMHTEHRLDTDKAIVDSIVKQMEGRAAVRNDAFKMIMEAAIKVKLGKIEHEQNIEKNYMTKLHDYLFELYRTGQKRAAEDYIDKVFKDSTAGDL